MNRDENYTLLIAAIINRAYKDMVDACKISDNLALRRYYELSKFFESEYCYNLCGIDGKMLIAKLDKIFAEEWNKRHKKKKVRNKKCM